MPHAYVLFQHLHTSECAWRRMRVLFFVFCFLCFVCQVTYAINCLKCSTDFLDSFIFLLATIFQVANKCLGIIEISCYFFFAVFCFQSSVFGFPPCFVFTYGCLCGPDNNPLCGASILHQSISKCSLSISPTCLDILFHSWLLIPGVSGKPVDLHILAFLLCLLSILSQHQQTHLDFRSKVQMKSNIFAIYGAVFSYKFLMFQCHFWVIWIIFQKLAFAVRRI